MNEKDNAYWSRYIEDIHRQYRERKAVLRTKAMMLGLEWDDSENRCLDMDDDELEMYEEE